MSGKIKIELNPVVRADMWQVRRAGDDGWAFYHPDQEDEFDVSDADFVLGDYEIKEYRKTLEILQALVEVEKGPL